MKYRLYRYDLWGNEEDGYAVNDVFETDTVLKINSGASSRSIIRKIKKKYSRFSDYDVTGEDIIYVNYMDNPCCEMRRED